MKGYFLLFEYYYKKSMAGSKVYIPKRFKPNICLI